MSQPDERQDEMWHTEPAVESKEPIVVDEEDIALMSELNMLELLGRAKSFQQIFPQYNVYFINYK